MADNFPNSQNQAKPVGLAGLPIPAPLGGIKGQGKPVKLKIHDNHEIEITWCFKVSVL